MKLKQEEKDTIKQLAPNHTIREIAEITKIRRTNVYQYLYRNKIEYKIDQGQAIKQYETIILSLQKVSGIYYIKNITNGRFYIGISIDVGSRIQQHISRLYYKTHVNTDMQKDYNLGDEFQCGIICSGPQESLLNIEIYLIYLNKYNPKCYNKTMGKDLPILQDSEIYRFYKKVSKTDKCWTWIGKKNRDGYGYMNVGGRKITAHRLSFYINNNQDPNGFLVCHKCDNRECVNPQHLFLGSNSDNMQDCSKKGRTCKPKVTIDKLLKLKKQGYSTLEIEKITGYSGSTIRGRLNPYKDKNDKRGLKIEITKEDLEKLYQIKTNKEIASIYNCSEYTIGRKLKKYGLIRLKKEKPPKPKKIKEPIVERDSNGCWNYAELVDIEKWRTYFKNLTPVAGKPCNNPQCINPLHF